ncbi:MATE family efflux transporter [Oceanirhabdus seepicola]|uniref:MATE family efflux transporter n=1 Tax=Oceanirhabdus seepicola TaxID=2828781 RepID=A0A9J6P7E8_9CLOT|nr:MATE family efflux transporter [Oceanirhabdus seepicola]MCM1991733.1 MATE family efflux transporter [Oceanirhabdus seepicola]
MEKKNRAILTSGNVKSILIELTIPMIFGMLGMIIFNLVDTYFVGKLGTNQLAALTFTFPVVLIINSLAQGLGMGASSVISRAIGEGDHHKVQRLATDSLSLSIILVIIFVIIGLSTIEPIFELLGVNADIMPYVKEYMSIWYIGVVFVVVPMVGNNAIRALGDTKTPGIVMMVSATINVILDPLLIFGVGPFPRLGVAGAAIATVIARAVTFIVALYILIIREKIVIVQSAKIEEVISSWKKILYIGLPNALTKMINPIAMGIITSLVASHGIEVVAGYGVATRLERFALLLVGALSTIMAPFIGQNYGAGRMDRVKLSISLSEKFSLISSGVIFLILAIFAKPIAGLFSNDSSVISVVAKYLWIVPIGYGVQGILLISTSALNALNKPIHASILTIIQMFGLYVPLALLGSHLFGIIGIFGSIVVSYLISACISHYVVKKVLYNKKALDV